MDISLAVNIAVKKRMKRNNPSKTAHSLFETHKMKHKEKNQKLAEMNLKQSKSGSTGN